MVTGTVARKGCDRFRSSNCKYGGCEGRREDRWAMKSNPAHACGLPACDRSTNPASMATLHGRTSLVASCYHSDCSSLCSRSAGPAQPPLLQKPHGQCSCRHAAVVHPLQRRQPTTAQRLRRSEPWQPCERRSRTDRLVCCSAAAGAAEPGKTRIGFLGAGIMGTPMVRATHLCVRPASRPSHCGWHLITCRARHALPPSRE